MEPSTYEGHTSHVPQRKGVREYRSSAEGPWKDCPGVYSPLCVPFPPPTPPVTNLLGCPSPPCALQHGPCTDRAAITRFALLAASLIMPHLLPRSSCITCCLAHRASPAASLIMPHLLPRSSCLNCCLAHPALPAASLIMPHLLPHSSCLTCCLAHHASLAASLIMPHLLPHSSCLACCLVHHASLAASLILPHLIQHGVLGRRPAVRQVVVHDVKDNAQAQPVNGLGGNKGLCHDTG